jgi:hypothetical protein
LLSPAKSDWFEVSDSCGVLRNKERASRRSGCPFSLRAVLVTTVASLGPVDASYLPTSAASAEVDVAAGSAEAAPVAEACVLADAAPGAGSAAEVVVAPGVAAPPDACSAEEARGDLPEVALPVDAHCAPAAQLNDSCPGGSARADSARGGSCPGGSARADSQVDSVPDDYLVALPADGRCASGAELGDSCPDGSCPGGSARDDSPEDSLPDDCLVVLPADGCCGSAVQTADSPVDSPEDSHLDVRCPDARCPDVRLRQAESSDDCRAGSLADFPGDSQVDWRTADPDGFRAGS